MQIELQFSSSGENVLSFNYQYKLASALYRTLTARAPALAKELHDGTQRSRIKLFVFSLFNSEPKPEVVKLPDGRNGLKFGKRAWMRFGSIWPELLYQMADALQQAGELNICGQKFHLESLEMVKSPEFRPEMVYRPFGQAGFIVCPFKKAGKTLYQMPDDSEPGIPSCRELIAGNLRHKLLRLREIRPDIFENIMSIGNLSADAVSELPIRVEFLPLSETCAYRTRLVQFKGVNIRGFRAPVRITAPEAVHRIVWETGAGALNSSGWGMMELGRQ